MDNPIKNNKIIVLLYNLIQQYFKQIINKIMYMPKIKKISKDHNMMKKIINISKMKTTKLDLMYF
jgi:hypothetical protein